MNIKRFWEVGKFNTPWEIVNFETIFCEDGKYYKKSYYYSYVPNEDHKKEIFTDKNEAWSACLKRVQEDVDRAKHAYDVVLQNAIADGWKQ